ncbi:MAG TPA: glycine cleavage system protein GcvH [Armatimonadota bacterium]|nr:glycine cleavage system protein GcvH [Armatimonadota bacterium]
MNIRDDLKYTSTHEWLRRGSDGAAVGITDYAQSELTDIVFVELPEVGRHLDAGDEICALESVKAVAYVYAPLAGTIAAVNEKLSKQPELINQDPYGEGWIVQLAPDDPEKSVDLLDAAGYKQKLEEEH